MMWSLGIDSKEPIPLGNVAWQIRKIEAERTLFIPQIGKIKAKQCLFIPQIRKIEAELTRLTR